MRGAFIRALTELADTDPRVVLMTADLGFSVIETFADRHPDRFFNVGVAEQNMVGLATGLAEGGYLPFVYSIATFASLRGYEFLRNGGVLQHLPVRVVAVGGGFEYGHAGPTHHALEDVAVMRAQTGLLVIAPADFQQAETALRATWDRPEPIYYRLGKDDRTTVPGLDGRFALGRAQRVREGIDALFVTLGPTITAALEASDSIAGRGIQAGVMCVASVAPPPLDDLADAIAGVPLVVTVEAHSVTGGLGSLVAELIAERALPARLVRCGVRSGIGGPTGGEAFLAARHGLTAAGLASAVQDAMAVSR